MLLLLCRRGTRGLLARYTAGRRTAAGVEKERTLGARVKERRKET